MIEPITDAYYGTNDTISAEANTEGNQPAFEDKPISDLSPIDKETTANQTIGAISYDMKKKTEQFPAPSS